MHEWSLFAPISCRDSLEFILFTSANSFFIIVFCKPASHWTQVSRCLFSTNQMCVAETLKMVLQGGTVHMWDLLVVFMKWSWCMKWSECMFDSTWQIHYIFCHWFKICFVYIKFSWFSLVAYCSDLCVNQSLYQDTVSAAPHMHIPLLFMHIRLIDSSKYVISSDTI